MTIRHDHADCDGGCGAVTPIASDWFEEWERLPMQSGPESHLCPRCQRERDRGWLAEEFVLECIRCHRNTKDHPGEVKQWWGVPDPEGLTRSASVCDDCHDPETDSFRVG